MLPRGYAVVLRGTRVLTGMVGKVAVMLVLGLLSGCAPPPPPAPPVARPADGVRRLAIVASGDTKFTVVEHRSEPGRTFDEVAKWLPYGWLRPLGALIHSGINSLIDSGRGAVMAPDIGMSPRLLVAEVLLRRLHASRLFEEVHTLESEPLGEERWRTDALVRVTVPGWGLVRIRRDPDLLSAFADVRAEMVIPGSGVVVWEISEDVTDPERLPPAVFARDRSFARQKFIDVLERAGQRLASELIYAWGPPP
jgi:hypothetical protein